MDLYKIADNLNVLSDFLGKRDIDTLTSNALEGKYQITQTDLLILFGASVAYGCDVVGQAVSNNIAKNFMIVGGEGHTTESLRRAIHTNIPEIETMEKMEADIMSEYIKRKYGIGNILIERNSTNCGNNITYALDVIKQNNLFPNNIVIVQDATMQCRMDAGFRKYLLDSKVEVINFAAYKVRVEVKSEKLVIEPTDIWGMWDIERYISLLMGEIPRLLDDTNGYGPNGKNYIAHVDIPAKVLKAFEELKVEYGDLVRVANTLYASKDA
ncbi:hypothetical protein ASG89_27240 [Paenibacillus sp. Soil766]|uniref:ElyC/SanA/YdcF family protein n=1 Tax=Paenibacillus sp. Soil766 TaxID=1736404 RepID=UPI000708D496|nr:ElyC/SanA/YdcF family protein [Paenibacillus sp. Soil766]KRE99830.1 hypothetical protein ASG89_27240 [Paenibacillus sp. Soil766]